jgi:hypothetical protein
MATEVIQQDGIGTIFRLTVKEDNSAVDISTATTKQIIFQRPDGEKLTKTATFTNTGTNGKIEYATVSGDLSLPGEWAYQGYVVMPSWSGYTSVKRFQVSPNL